MFNRKKIKALEEQIALQQRDLNAHRSQASRNYSLYQDLQERLEKSNRAHAETSRNLKDLWDFYEAHGGQAVWEQDKVLEAVKRQQSDVKSDIARLEKERDDLQKELRPQRLRAIEERAGWRDFDHPAKDSIALQVELRELRSEISAKVRSYTAVTSLDDIEPPKTKAQRNKMVKDNARLVMRAFNAEVENVISSATATNFDASVEKIYRSVNQLEKLTEASGVKLSTEYIELRIRELRLAVEHIRVKKTERELEREHKAELREQARAERELEAERERLEKEKQHYLNVLSAVEAAGDEEQAQKLREEIVAIEKGIGAVEERAANIRAGYVYVISNIGSFGSEVVKIGMTRRLEPMDRVKELGDASVPFGFDVHALFFSEDAVGLENALHKHFADRRINRINMRREFFRATPAEVRDVLASMAGNLLEFVEEPEAEQYRLSIEASLSSPAYGSSAAS